MANHQYPPPYRFDSWLVWLKTHHPFISAAAVTPGGGEKVSPIVDREDVDAVLQWVSTEFFPAEIRLEVMQHMPWTLLFHLEQYHDPAAPHTGDTMVKRRMRLGATSKYLIRDVWRLPLSDTWAYDADGVLLPLRARLNQAREWYVRFVRPSHLTDSSAGTHSLPSMALSPPYLWHIGAYEMAVHDDEQIKARYRTWAAFDGDAAAPTGINAMPPDDLWFAIQRGLGDLIRDDTDLTTEVFYLRALTLSPDFRPSDARVDHYMTMVSDMNNGVGFDAAWYLVYQVDVHQMAAMFPIVGEPLDAETMLLSLLRGVSFHFFAPRNRVDLIPLASVAAAYALHVFCRDSILSAPQWAPWYRRDEATLTEAAAHLRNIGAPPPFNVRSATLFALYAAMWKTVPHVSLGLVHLIQRERRDARVALAVFHALVAYARHHGIDDDVDDDEFNERDHIAWPRLVPADEAVDSVVQRAITLLHCAWRQDAAWYHLRELREQFHRAAAAHATATSFWNARSTDVDGDLFDVTTTGAVAPLWQWFPFESLPRVFVQMLPHLNDDDEENFSHLLTLLPFLQPQGGRYVSAMWWIEGTLPAVSWLRRYLLPGALEIYLWHDASHRDISAAGLYVHARRWAYLLTHVPVLIALLMPYLLFSSTASVLITDELVLAWSKYLRRMVMDLATNPPTAWRDSIWQRMLELGDAWFLPTKNDGDDVARLAHLMHLPFWTHAKYQRARAAAIFGHPRGDLLVAGLSLLVVGATTTPVFTQALIGNHVYVDARTDSVFTFVARDVSTRPDGTMDPQIGSDTRLVKAEFRSRKTYGFTALSDSNQFPSDVLEASLRADEMWSQVPPKFDWYCI